MRARREFYQPYVPDFFVCVFVLYWLARRRPIQNILLLVAGYVFYGWFHPWYAVMLGLSTIGDFFLANDMKRAPFRRKLFLSLRPNLYLDPVHLNASARTMFTHILNDSLGALIH
jgi:hypothetical protein